MSIDHSRIESVTGSDGELTCIGRGGFGAVFLARLRTSGGGGEDVAVKRVGDLTDSRAAAQFRVEYKLHLRLALRLDGVCRIYGMCEGHPVFHTCFVMRRYKCSLLDEIKSAGEAGIPLRRALTVLAKVAKTMASLHTAYNLIVADLKPSNILIDERGDAVVSDFGVSRVVTSTMGSFGLSPSKVGGTFNYQSPEQLGAEDADGNALGVTTQSDVWNFACTALHAITGEAPWWDASAGAPASNAKVIGAVVFQKRSLPQLALLPASAPAELRELLSSCFSFEAPTRPRFFGADDSGARTTIHGIAFRLARLRDAAAGEAAASIEDGAAQQSTLDDIRDAIEAAGRWGDEAGSSDAFAASAAAPAPPPTLRSQASAALSAHAYLQPLKFGARKLAQYVATFDAEGYEQEEDLRDFVVDEGKTVADLVAEFKMSGGHARRLIKHLRGTAAPLGAPSAPAPPAPEALERELELAAAAAANAQGGPRARAASAAKTAKDTILAEIAKGSRQARESLKTAAPALKADKDVVLAAVAQYGRALEYAEAAVTADHHRDHASCATPR
jgi:hypothetical protein